MGSEKGAEFYDQHMEKLGLPLEQSPWRRLYEVTATLLPDADQCPTIIDVGCGTGRFAKVIRDLGYSKYWGIDFSSVRVQEAQRYVPGFTFVVGNVFDASTQDNFKKHKVFVVTEVLEHLERDRELLQAFPSGSMIIFSVPSYDAQAHVRFFKSQDDVINRYKDILLFNAEGRHVLPHGNGGSIFLFRCTRR